MVKFFNKWRKIERKVTNQWLLILLGYVMVATTGRVQLIEFLGKMPEYYGIYGVIIWAVMWIPVIWQMGKFPLYSLLTYGAFHGLVIWELAPTFGHWIVGGYGVFFALVIIWKAYKMGAFDDK